MKVKHKKKKKSLNDIIRNSNKNNSGRLFLQSKLNYLNKLPLPNKSDLKTEIDRAEYCFQKWINDKTH